MTVPTRRRALLGGVALIVLWLAVEGAPAAVESFRETRWTLADRVRLLEQSRHAIGQEQTVFDSAARIKDVIVALAPRLLSGSTRAEAVNALNGMISLAADRSNAKLTGITPEDDSARAGSLRRVALRGAFDCDVRGLVAILWFLLDQEVVLVTDRLQVLVAEPGGSPNGAEVLRVELTVRGWYQAGAEEADEPGNVVSGR
jgi:hypothetical protein